VKSLLLFPPPLTYRRGESLEKEEGGRKILSVPPAGKEKEKGKKKEGKRGV